MKKVVSFDIFTHFYWVLIFRRQIFLLKNCFKKMVMLSQSTKTMPLATDWLMESILKPMLNAWLKVINLFFLVTTRQAWRLFKWREISHYCNAVYQVDLLEKSNRIVVSVYKIFLNVNKVLLRVSNVTNDRQIQIFGVSGVIMGGFKWFHGTRG